MKMFEVTQMLQLNVTGDVEAENEEEAEAELQKLVDALLATMRLKLNQNGIVLEHVN